MAVASPPRSDRSYPSLPPLPKGEWPAQGEWTYEDYQRLPDAPGGARYEVLFGVLHITNTPDFDHQFAVSRIDRKVGGYVDGRRLGVFLVAPFEVRLPGVADPVQPDALFVRAALRALVKRQYVEGAPDLVVEVLSPSTRRQDYGAKMDAYELAGVAEYWVVDPKARTVEVYESQEGKYTLLGEFAAGETLQSRVLQGLGLDVAELFEG